MATNSDSGATGIVGVIVGVIIVIGLVLFLFGGNLGMGPQKDVNVKVESPTAPNSK